MIFGVGVGVNNWLICAGRIRWGWRLSLCWCCWCAPHQWRTTTSIGIFMWSLALTGSRYSGKMSSKQLILRFKNLTLHSSIPHFLLFNLNSICIIQGFICLFLLIGNYLLTNSNILAFYLQDMHKRFCCIDALAKYLPSNISWTRTIGTSPSTYTLTKVILLRCNIQVFTIPNAIHWLQWGSCGVIVGWLLILILMMLILMLEELMNITHRTLCTSSDKPTNEGVVSSASVDGLCWNFYPFQFGS